MNEQQTIEAQNFNLRLDDIEQMIDNNRRGIEYAHAGIIKMAEEVISYMQAVVSNHSNPHKINSGADVLEHCSVLCTRIAANETFIKSNSITVDALAGHLKRHYE